NTDENKKESTFFHILKYTQKGLSSID
ncbi:MAG: hypothetical protein ACI8UQ_001543, partial [Bacteroidia bacterium]